MQFGGLTKIAKTPQKSHPTFTQKNLQAPKLQSPKNLKAPRFNQKPQSATQSFKLLANFGKIKNILTNHPKTVDTKI